MSIRHDDEEDGSRYGVKDVARRAFLRSGGAALGLGLTAARLADCYVRQDDYARAVPLLREARRSRSARRWPGRLACVRLPPSW